MIQYTGYFLIVYQFWHIQFMKLTAIIQSSIEVRLTSIGLENLLTHILITINYLLRISFVGELKQNNARELRF